MREGEGAVEPILRREYNQHATREGHQHAMREGDPNAIREALSMQ